MELVTTLSYQFCILKFSNGSTIPFIKVQEDFPLNYLERFSYLDNAQSEHIDFILQQIKTDVFEKGLVYHLEQYQSTFIDVSAVHSDVYDQFSGTVLFRLDTTLLLKILNEWKNFLTDYYTKEWVCVPRSYVKQEYTDSIHSMNSPAFIAFKTAKHAFFRWENVHELSDKVIALSDDFQKSFPQLSKLLKGANARHITIENEPHTLYTWQRTDGAPCGWLCKNEKDIPGFPILDQHQLLLTEMGGIRESYGSNEPDLALNQHFLFTGSRCEPALGNQTKFYEGLCQEQGLKPLKTDLFITFVLEANGNRTLYDRSSQKVLLYLYDHNFDYVTPVPKQPEFTFHTMQGVDTFTEYVELLARQWLDFVELKVPES